MSERTPRMHGAHAYLAIKAGFRRLVSAAGGQESAASITRIRTHQTIGRYGRPQDADQYAPVDVIADLERDTGEPHVTRILADLAGFVLIPKPDAQGEDALSMAGLGALAKESGDCLTKLGSALADGKITADESRALELRREVNEAMAVLARIDRALDVIERT